MRSSNKHIQHWLLLLWLIVKIHSAESISRCSRRVMAPSLPRYSGRTLLADNRRSYNSPYHSNSRRDQDPFALPAARTKSKKQVPPETTTNDPFARPMTTQELYAGLGPIGRCVAGTVEIAVSTVMEYITGFVGGFTIGYLVGLPMFVFQKMDKEQTLPFMQEMSQRFGRMNSQSVRWAKSWGAISATFGGFRVATRVVRGGKEDEWNTVFSSAGAGAFFARKEGPQAMLRAAIIYGGLVYLISGGLGPKTQPFGYNDQPIAFAKLKKEID